MKLIGYLSILCTFYNKASVWTSFVNAVMTEIVEILVRFLYVT
jgi:hypothetical protein